MNQDETHADLKRVFHKHVEADPAQQTTTNQRMEINSTVQPIFLLLTLEEVSSVHPGLSAITNLHSSVSADFAPNRFSDGKSTSVAFHGGVLSYSLTGPVLI